MSLRHTPLHSAHAALGARLVPFAGYEMPVQYPTGITAEHQAVRTAAGLFDVSHMGEVEIRGEGARDFVQYLTTNDVDRIEVGQAQYSTLLNDRGTILDDLLVYRFPEHYLLVVNASNRAKDVAQLERHAARFGVRVADRSEELALLALQGPRAEEILSRLTGTPLGSIGYYRFREGAANGTDMIISRTGYTGEDGFELYLENAGAAALWPARLDAAIIAADCGESASRLTRAAYPESGRFSPATKVETRRAAEGFEALRAASDACLARTGNRPKVFLAKMGAVKQHKPRADFAAGFFAVGGFEALAKQSFDTAENAALAAVQSGAPIAVLCSTDETYPELAPAFAKAAKAVNPSLILVLAGYPTELVVSLRSAGFDEFIHVRSDVRSTLENFLNRIGALPSKS